MLCSYRLHKGSMASCRELCTQQAGTMAPGKIRAYFFALLPSSLSHLVVCILSLVCHTAYWTPHRLDFFSSFEMQYLAFRYWRARSFPAYTVAVESRCPAAAPPICKQIPWSPVPPRIAKLELSSLIGNPEPFLSKDAS